MDRSMSNGKLTREIADEIQPGDYIEWDDMSKVLVLDCILEVDNDTMTLFHPDGIEQVRIHIEFANGERESRLFWLSDYVWKFKG